MRNQQRQDYYATNAKIASNILERQFSASQSDQKWVANICGGPRIVDAVGDGL